MIYFVASIAAGEDAMALDEATVRKFERELNAGAAALVLLGILDRAETPLYGYRIAKRLEGAAKGSLHLKQGTLYPVLRSLEAVGLLRSEVEPSITGPPRRYYEITADGREMLARWRGIWGETRDFVDAVLDGEIVEAGAAGGTDNGALDVAGGTHA